MATCHEGTTDTRWLQSTPKSPVPWLSPERLLHSWDTRSQRLEGQPGRCGSRETWSSQAVDRRWRSAGAAEIAEALLTGRPTALPACPKSNIQTHTGCLRMAVNSDAFLQELGPVSGLSTLRVTCSSFHFIPPLTTLVSLLLSSLFHS